MRIQPAAAARARSSRSGSGLARTAYESLHRRIMQGDFAPGEILSRRRIAAELGMSFLPASEAFLRLEWDGLLERRPRAGTRLRIPSRQDVEGHFVMAEALEAQAAMLFVERSTEEERARPSETGRARGGAAYPAASRSARLCGPSPGDAHAHRRLCAL